MLKQLLLLIILSQCFCLSGQTFRFGAIGGLNICKLNGNENSEFNYAGYKIGGRIATDLHRQFRTSMDILYSRKGNIVNQFPDPSSNFDNIKLDYIEVPVMFTFMDWMDDPNEQEYWRLHFTAGVSFSKLVSYQVRNNLDIDVTDQQSFNKNKISFLAGLVYYINEHLGINVQYSGAFSNIQKRSSYPTMKSRVWSLNFIYMMDNKRRKTI